MLICNRMNINTLSRNNFDRRLYFECENRRLLNTDYFLYVKIMLNPLHGQYFFDNQKK
jgi:hypothetical protein